ncbi:MAG: DUF58 domain-containing protein [Lachnospiraceae bacterium]|nr:DUF58 domain-containing protein [Lachnospiraceae bacterium]
MAKRKWLGWFLDNSHSKTASWVSYAFMVLFSLFMSFFYLQSFFYLITVLLICLPVLSYNLTAPLADKLTVSIKLADDRLTLEIDNPGIIPVSCAEVTLSVRSLFYGGPEDEVHSLSLKSRSASTLSFPITMNKYGIYEVRVFDLLIYDPIHLFSFKRPLDIRQSHTILPDSSDVKVHREIVYEEGFDEFTDTGLKGNASSNVTDIREYRPGDRLSRIHWKLTEKLDTLIVKENETTSSNEFTVLLELYQPDKDECEKIYREGGSDDASVYNTLNRAIGEAWSVSNDLLDAGEPFVFMFYNEKAADFAASRINSRDDLQEAMTRAFYAGSYTTKDLALSVYRKTIQDKGTLIHVG